MLLVAVGSKSLPPGTALVGAGPARPANSLCQSRSRAAGQSAWLLVQKALALLSGGVKVPQAGVGQVTGAVGL